MVNIDYKKMRLSLGGIVVLLFSLCLPLFTYTYTCRLWSVIGTINLNSQQEGYFVYSFVVALVVSLIFISANSFAAILNHELTHNIWALLSFSRPTSLQVKAGKGGSFVFSGRKNIMTVLSPYFFPLFTFFIFPLYFIISSRYLPYYFIVLGLSFGYSVAMEIKQSHYLQPDFRIYGVVPSYLIIIFFQIFILGLLTCFVVDGVGGVGNFVVEPTKDAYIILRSVFKRI